MLKGKSWYQSCHTKRKGRLCLLCEYQWGSQWMDLFMSHANGCHASLLSIIILVTKATIIIIIIIISIIIILCIIDEKSTFRCTSNLCCQHSIQIFLKLCICTGPSHGCRLLPLGSWIYAMDSLLVPSFSFLFFFSFFCRCSILERI